MNTRRTSLNCAFAGALVLAGCASTANSPTTQGTVPPAQPGPTSVSIPAIVSPTSPPPVTTPPTTAAQTPPPTTAPPATYPPVRTSPPAPPPPPPPPSINPATVVEEYYAAINSHDYSRAWALGGKNLGQSYGEFITGFADTEVDSVEIVSTHGHTVSVYLTADNYDGSQQTFAGSYTVSGDQITGASISQTG